MAVRPEVLSAQQGSTTNPMYKHVPCCPDAVNFTSAARTATKLVPAYNKTCTGAYNKSYRDVVNKTSNSNLNAAGRLAAALAVLLIPAKVLAQGTNTVTFAKDDTYKTNPIPVKAEPTASYVFAVQAAQQMKADGVAEIENADIRIANGKDGVKKQISG